MHGRRGLLIAATAVLCWLFAGAVFYYAIENCSAVPRLKDGVVTEVYQCPWNFAQSFYFSVQTGLSIGFGLLSESETASKVYSIFHILVGSSVISGALGLFASLALSRNSHFLSKEERRLARASHALHADGFEGFKLEELHKLMVTYPHYTNAMIRKVYKDPSEASRRIKEFAKADEETRNTLASALLKEACGTLEELKHETITINDLVKMEEQYASKMFRLKAFLWHKRNLITVSTVFILWIILGTVFSVTADKNDFVTGVYYAVSTLSTAGMVSVKTVDFDAHVIFTAFYALIGVPIYCTFLGLFANVAVDRYYAKQTEEALHKKFTASEMEFLNHLTANTHKTEVSLAEFVEFQLLRLGKVDRDLLRTLRDQFSAIDKEGTGKVSKEAFLHEVEAEQKADQEAAEEGPASTNVEVKQEIVKGVLGMQAAGEESTAAVPEAVAAAIEGEPEAVSCRC